MTPPSPVRALSSASGWNRLCARGRNALLAFALLGGVSPAFAQVASESSASAQPQALRVWLDLGTSGIDPARVQAAIAHELKTDVQLAESADTPLRVAVGDDRHARVTYKTEAGEELARTVELPDNAERKVEVIALMVGNLTRNEAAELLAALKPKPEEKPAEAAKPEPTPPAAPPSSPPPPPPPTAPKPLPNLGSGYLYADPSGVHASVFYPMAVLRDSERRVFAIELAAAYGRVGAIQGIALSLGALRVEHQVQGLALALGMTQVNGPLRGVQGSVLYNEGHGEQVGMNFSGLMLYQRAKITGFAVSGLASILDDVEGVDLAGAFTAARNVRGGQVAGVVSVATERVEGTQISGAVQSSSALDGVAVSGLVTRSGRTRGFAVSGLLNVTGDLDGGSFALVNVGGKVRGTQIGFVNVASEIEGVQLGVVNYSQKNGDTQVLGFCSNIVPFNAAVKFTTGYSYSEVGVGTTFKRDENMAFLGAGGHFPVGRFAFQLGARMSTTQATDPNTGGPKRSSLHYLGSASLRLFRGFEVFAGAGARHIVIGDGSGSARFETVGGVALF
ncbi:MAG: hypothetical protein ACOY0T_17495 [Myxococcota bacterium]